VRCGHAAGETDWRQIALLYEALAKLTPSPVVKLNRAVAVAMAGDTEQGLRIVDGSAASTNARATRARSAGLAPISRSELACRRSRPGLAAPRVGAWLLPRRPSGFPP
jgi:predicted RNA polymerase sigma factor